jgi:hypothetical protein
MRRVISVAEQMQAEEQKGNIVDHVHQDCVEGRTSYAANVSSGYPGEEGIREHNRVPIPRILHPYPQARFHATHPS